MSDDAVFRALADSSRRELLDRLRERDGRTSQDLCRGLSMSRQAVAKHLLVLEEAHLVSTRRQGREKLHFVNTTPIADAAEGWMARFRRPLPPLASLVRWPEQDEEIETSLKVGASAGDAVRSAPRPLRALRPPPDDENDGTVDGDDMQGARTTLQASLTTSARTAAPRRGLRILAKLTGVDDG